MASKSLSLCKELSPLEANLMKALDDRPAPTMIEVLLKVLDEKGLSKAHLGLDERGLPIDAFEKLSHELSKATITRASGIFKEGCEDLTANLSRELHICY